MVEPKGMTDFVGEYAWKVLIVYTNFIFLRASDDPDTSR
jgi:hypothetical protein